MTKLKPHPDVVAREVGTELVLVHLGRNEIFSTNLTGARIWALLGEGVPEGDLVGRLLTEFDAERLEAVEREVQDFLGLIRAEGLVVTGES